MKKALFGALLAALVSFNAACDRPAAVEQAVESKLRSENITNVEAKYQDGVVVLEGYVADEAAHARARTIAQETGGVKSVADHLKVVYVQPEPEPENTITQPEVDTGGALKEYKRHSNNGNNQNLDPALSPHAPSNTTNPAGNTGSPSQGTQPQNSNQPKK